MCVEHNATMWINGETTCTFVQQYAQIDSQMLHVVGARPIDGRGVLSIFWHFFVF